MDSQIGFPPLTMAVFVGIALGALLLDMVTHRGDKPISLAKASIWSIFWIAISLAFAGFLYVQHGPEVAGPCTLQRGIATGLVGHQHAVGRQRWQFDACVVVFGHPLLLPQAT